MWGGEDLAADLGAIANRDASGAYTAPYQLARSLCLYAAAAASVPAIDAVYTDFRDTVGLKAESAEGLRDGFSGKAAIHPDQVAPINAAFTPSAADVERARRIVAAFEASTATGVASLDGRMLDRPHLRGARRVLERAREAGALD
jgi:citrate lyase subunit beta/citryl-CoA lyase